MKNQWLKRWLPICSMVLMILVVAGKVDATPIRHLSNDTLGAWQLTTSMNAIRLYHTSVVIGNYIYVMGGSDGTQHVATVERAVVNPGGSLGSWEIMTSMTIARMHPAAAVYGNYLYVSGGEQLDYGGPVDSVERAHIESNGSLGSWEIISHLPSPLQQHASVASGGYLYVLGGYTGSAITNQVLRAQINPNGSLGTWEIMTSLETARSTNFAVTNDHYIYVLGGGSSPGTSLNTVERAEIQPNGTLGPWEFMSSMIQSRTFLGAVIAGDSIYAAGGSGPCSLDTVESS